MYKLHFSLWGQAVQSSLFYTNLPLAKIKSKKQKALQRSDNIRVHVLLTVVSCVSIELLLLLLKQFKTEVQGNNPTHFWIQNLIIN